MKLSKSALVVCILAPTTLVTFLSSEMAFRQLKRDMVITSDILISRIDRMTSIARNAAKNAGKTAFEPCENIIKK